MHRLRHVDAMRGLAAIAVIYCHVAEYAMWNGLVSSRIERAIFAVFIEWMDLGKVAVTLFFAISGFVIPFSIFKFKDRPISRFLIGRVFRLYPAYWVSIPLGILFLFVLKDKPIAFWTVVANATMLQEFLGREDILGVYWTLQIELVFYAICIVLFSWSKLDDERAVGCVGLLFLLASVVLSVLRFYTDKKLPVALPLALSIMFWGLSVRYYIGESRVKWRVTFITLSASIVALIPIISLLAYNKNMGFNETWHKYTVTYYVALGAFMVLYRFIKVTSPPFVYLGAISYSIYLFGQVVQEFIFGVLGQNAILVPTHLVIAAAMLLTVAVAACVYHLVEAPAVALGRRLTSMLGLPGQAHVRV